MDKHDLRLPDLLPAELSNVLRFVAAVLSLCIAGLSDGKPVFAAGRQAVELELVLALDCSTSVDDREFDLQKQGLVRAFLHPDVVQAIGVAGPRGVAISVVQWADGHFQKTVVDWTLVKDRHGAGRLANLINNTTREIRGMTSTAGAIRYSVAAIKDNAYLGQRKVIDVSGDGSSNAVLSGQARDAANRAGITINGLVIFSKEYDLGALADINIARYYAANVIGGPGAFLMEARDYKDFQVAIRKKLIREISGNSLAVGR